MAMASSGKIALKKAPLDTVADRAGWSTEARPSKKGQAGYRILA